MSNMPPAESDISARDLWSQITAMPRPHRIVEFPKKDADGKPMAELAMQVLTQDESTLATASADKYTRKILKESNILPLKEEMSGSYSTIFENKASQEILFRACRKREDLSKPFFPTVEAIGAKLTTDEIGVLMMSYLRVQAELGPITSTMDQDTVDAWIERLATGGSSHPLGSLSLGSQSTLMLSMAERLWNSRTVSS